MKISIHRFKKGFTLIEVLISVVIFAVLSVYLMNAVTDTTQFQRQMDRILKEERPLSDIPQIIRKDVNMIFSSIHTSLFIAGLYKRYLEGNYPDYLENNIDAEDEPYLSLIEFPVLGFRGQKEKMIFSSSIKNSSETSSISKVQYSLEDCPSQSKYENKCLIRFYSDLKVGQSLDDLDSDSLKQTVLMGDISTLEFSYCAEPVLNDCESHEFREENIQGMYFPYNLPYGVQVHIQKNKKDDPIHLFIPIYSTFLNRHILQPQQHQLQKERSQKPQQRLGVASS